MLSAGKAYNTCRMKILNTIALIVGLVSFGAFAAEEKPAAKARPYPLKTCVVTDEKFGGDMGDPYVFTHEGREVKLCCEGCLKDFKKNSAKYMKKMDAAEKKEAGKKK
jgi:hypothetical protein